MSVEAKREQEQRVASSRRAPYRPALSVILISEGSRIELERALAAVAGRCASMEAQILVVRARCTIDLSALEYSYPRVTFLEAPGGSSQAEMRELGMAHTCGDIVSLRMDGAVGDGVWLDAFRALVGTVDDDRPREVEVAIATAVESPAGQSERRRGRGVSSSSLGTSGHSRRRSDYGTTAVGLGDAPTRSGGLGAEM